MSRRVLKKKEFALILRNGVEKVVRVDFLSSSFHFSTSYKILCNASQQIKETFSVRPEEAAMLCSESLSVK